MREGWETAELASVSEVFTDGNWIETKDQSSEGIRLVQTGNVGEGFFKDRRDKARWINNETFTRLNCFEVLPGDCLISRLPDPVGRGCLVPVTGDKMITAVDCTVVRPDKERIDPSYLVYYTQSREYLRDVDDLCTGTTRRRISRKNLGKITIPLPPLEEQRLIVAVLDEAFEGLARARAHAETNLQNARELFENFASGLFDEITAIPLTVMSHVKELTLAEKGSIRTGPFGSQLRHSEFVDQGIAVLGIDNAVNNEFRWGKKRFITEEKYDALRRYTVRPGDVIITIMGTCGRCAVIPEDIPVAINTKHLCCITLDQSRCLPAYLHAYFLHSPKARTYLTAQASGSVMDGLNMGIIKELPVDLPSLEQQSEVVKRLDELSWRAHTLAVSAEAKIADIDDLRQSLLQKAFAGELT